MKKNQSLLFKRLSSETEEILMENLHTFKGGGGRSDDIIELEEVVITPEDDIDIPEDPDPFEDGDPYPDENPWDDGDWGSDGGDGGTPPDEPESTCTCEMGLKEGNNGMIPEVKDANGILANLKNHLDGQKSFLSGLKSENIQQYGLTLEGVNRHLATLSSINSLIERVEDSNKNIRIENATVAGAATGELTKDISTGEYVIKIDPSGQSYADYVLLVHELVHVGQVLDGQVGFNDAGSATMVGMEDEISAYQMMYNLDAGAGGSPRIATEAGIKTDYPNTYNTLPSSGGKCAVHG